jgi:hypothetical protein
MFKLIGIAVLILLLLLGVEYVIASGALAPISRISITDKVTDGDIFIVKTISLEQYETTHDIYDKLKIGQTYTVRISNNKIIKVMT